MRNKNEVNLAIPAKDSREVVDQLQAAVDAIREHSAKNKVTIIKIGPCEIAIEDGMLKIGCSF